MLTFVSAIRYCGEKPRHTPVGLSLKASRLPQAGGITSALRLYVAPFDNIYLWKTNRFEVYTFLPNKEWHPFEPTVQGGECCFVRTGREVNWVCVFSINTQ